MWLLYQNMAENPPLGPKSRIGAVRDPSGKSERRVAPEILALLALRLIAGIGRQGFMTTIEPRPAELRRKYRSAAICQSAIARKAAEFERLGCAGGQVGPIV
jgi:hypothetical protein